MILKIYLATVIITFISAVLGDIRLAKVCKIYGYKRYKRTLAERLSGWLLCLIIFALPIVNIIIAIYMLAINDDKLLETVKYNDNWYKVGEGE